MHTPTHTRALAQTHTCTYKYTHTYTGAAKTLTNDWDEPVVGWNVCSRTLSKYGDITDQGMMCKYVCSCTVTRAQVPTHILAWILTHTSRLVPRQSCVHLRPGRRHRDRRLLLPHQRAELSTSQQEILYPGLTSGGMGGIVTGTIISDLFSYLSDRLCHPIQFSTQP